MVEWTFCWASLWESSAWRRFIWAASNAPVGTPGMTTGHADMLLTGRRFVAPETVAFDAATARDREAVWRVLVRA
jgi:hypothetical protein